MFIDSQKLREAIEKKDELNIYSEFHIILESIVNLSKHHKKLSKNDEINIAVNILTEIYTIATNIYLKLKEMSNNEIFEQLDNMERLGNEAECILKIEDD